MEAIQRRSGEQMAQPAIGTDRLDRLEATVRTLSDKVAQIWDFVVPYQHLHNTIPGPKRATSAPPALSIRAPIRDISPLKYCPEQLTSAFPPSLAEATNPTSPSSGDVPATCTSAQPPTSVSPEELPPQQETARPEETQDAVMPPPAPVAAHPGVTLLPATPLNSQDSADTHTTLIKPAVAASPLASVAPQPLPPVSLPVPEGPAHGTRSRSRSRSVMSTLDVPGSPGRQTHSRSLSHSDNSNMDIDGPKRGHKRKASNSKAERELRRQRK
jgi:hypothetical protein